MSTSPPTLTRNHTSSSSIPQEYFLEEREEKSSSLYRRDVEPKLSNSHVFDKIRPLVCSINSSKGESSGFFINHRGTLLTVAHNIPEENANERVQFTTDYVQIDYGIQGNPYFSQPSDGIVQGHAKVLDLYSMESKIQLPESSIIPVLPEDIQLQEGMKVYFAGYPLGHDTVTFHKGTISSIIEDQGIKRFTIELDNQKIEKEFSAYILISADLQILKQKKKTQYDLAEEIKRSYFVDKVSIVSGGTDLIALIRVKDVNEFDEVLLGKLQKIDGIEKTQSLIVIHEC